MEGGKITEERAATKKSDEAWAYDSGDVIERGSVILSRTEQDFGYGLRQQYFHKCVILVLEHDASFTRGIILNRPTDLVLSEDDFVHDDGAPLEDADPSRKWRVWFGGDVKGIFESDEDGDGPEVTCLHSLRSDAAKDVSDEVLKDIRWTTLAGARGLVSVGEAKPGDFWVFCGYAGWGGGQLEDELIRQSWYMAATDSGTLLEELKSLEQGSDPRDAGVGTWELLMGMIGRGEEAKRAGRKVGGEGDREGEVDDEARFDDLMLYEWARERLVFSSSSSSTSASVDDDGDNERDDDGPSNVAGRDRGDDDDYDYEIDAAIDDMIRRATQSVQAGSNIRPGMFVRASGSVRSPFLLDDQEFHKSIVLVLQDDASITVGVLLNLPSGQEADFGTDLGDEGGRSESSTTTSTATPQRYGGRYGVKGESEKPFVWLHRSEALRGARVGSPIGGNPNNVWICSQEDAAAAVLAGIATPSDFLVVNGFTIWEKTPVGVAATAAGEDTTADADRYGDGNDEDNVGVIIETAGGIRGEIWNGRFEVVPPEAIPKLWRLLSRQKLLTESTMEANIELSNAAWESAGAMSSQRTASNPSPRELNTGEQAAKEEVPADIFVHRSRTSVRELADAAHRSWVATFLLGDPNLRGA